MLGSAECWCDANELTDAQQDVAHVNKSIAVLVKLTEDSNGTLKGRLLPCDDACISADGIVDQTCLQAMLLSAPEQHCHVSFAGNDPDRKSRRLEVGSLNSMIATSRTVAHTQTDFAVPQSVQLGQKSDFCAGGHAIEVCRSSKINHREESRRCLNTHRARWCFARRPTRWARQCRSAAG